MRLNFLERGAVYAVQDECLVRVVTGRVPGDSSGGGGTGAQDRRYTHRCPKQAFETVAHAIAETPAQGAGTSMGAIARQERLPFTQVNVALEFLKERGLVDVRHRRCFTATQDVYLDAMVEYHAIAEAVL